MAAERPAVLSRARAGSGAAGAGLFLLAGKVRRDGVTSPCHQGNRAGGLAERGMRSGRSAAEVEAVP